VAQALAVLKSIATLVSVATGKPVAVGFDRLAGVTASQFATVSRCVTDDDDIVAPLVCEPFADVMGVAAGLLACLEPALRQCIAGGAALVTLLPLTMLASDVLEAVRANVAALQTSRLRHSDFGFVGGSGDATLLLDTVLRLHALCSSSRDVKVDLSRIEAACSAIIVSGFAVRSLSLGLSRRRCMRSRVLLLPLLSCACSYAVLRRR
jgi:hypothetical protein